MRNCVCSVCNVEFKSNHVTKYCLDHKDIGRKNKLSKLKPKTINEENRIYKNCIECNKEFWHFKSARRLYCSYDCHLASGGALRAGLESKKATMKYGARKDANHKEIVEALTKAGATVIDMSAVGGGFPDLILGYSGKTFLVEIKNLKTRYGKRGLNKNQVEWKERWKGGPYCIVTDIESALRVLKVMQDV